MKYINWPGALRSLAVVAAAVCATPAAVASDRLDGLFSKIEPSLRERAFMRLNYIHANVKTTSGDAYDVTGPVVARGDIGTYMGTGSGYTSMFYRNGSTTVRTTTGFYNIIDASLTGAMDADAATENCPSMAAGLGTPCGIKARSSTTLGTPAVSLGYYLDEGMNWVIEAFVLAAPLSAEVYGDGDNGLNGKKIIDIKILPPTMVIGRYFGASDSRIRPFVGLGASYALFMNARATEALNTYQGGGNPGDTTVSVKNALGFGPFFGVKAQFNEDWHFSVNIGKLRYKTEATLVTRNTTITADSEVLSDYGPQSTIANTVSVNLTAGRPSTVAPADGSTPQLANSTVGEPIAALTGLMCDLARAKYGNNECNHGTFVRKQKTTLDNTLFMFSVGRRF